jgi:hypothetical protein
MKCIITGHSSGLGKYLYEYFKDKGWDVVGMSRSNGYDISLDRTKIINQSLDADLFINNASSGNSQLELLKQLSTKIPNIITMGSASTDFLDIFCTQYTLDMKNLEEKCRMISMDPNIGNILLMKISFLDQSYSDVKPNRIDSDSNISYNKIAESIEFWLKHPEIRLIEYFVKLTPFTIEEIKRKTGNKEAVDDVLAVINNLLIGKNPNSNN